MRCPGATVAVTSLQFLSCFAIFILLSLFILKTPPKWQKNDLVSGGHGPAWPSWELAWTMNSLDWLRTSADKRMWSGQRAVVIRTGTRTELLGVKMGCPRSSCCAIVSDVLCVRSCVHFVCVCVYMCMCVCVQT